MTQTLPPEEVAGRLRDAGIEGIVETEGDALVIEPACLFDIAAHLKTAPGLELDYLNHITAIDFKDHFVIVYLLTSLKHNHSLVLRTRLTDRKSPSLPSVVELWQGADFQEREIFDLFGIRFEGHPNLKRIFLWDGFDGHPLRKDFGHGA